MTGHITYMCHCLNISVNIANKYYMDEHEKYKRDMFVTLEKPAISGWKFELDKKGVIVKYLSLVCVKHSRSSTLGWITFSCRNCNSGDVYSVNRPGAKLSYPIDTAIMSQPGDQVIIQKGAIFGKEIEKIRKKSTYSNTFHIVLNPDLPVNYTSLEIEKEDGQLNSYLLSQQKQVQQLLKQSLIDLTEATEKKIQLYQQEQESLLHREQNKVKYDSVVLWQTIKEISRTIHDEEKITKKIITNDAQASDVTDHCESDQFANDDQQVFAIQNMLEDPFEVETSKRESHVQLSHSNEFNNHHNQHRRRSSALKRDILGGTTLMPFTRRRSSYAIDESALARSLQKDAHLVESVNELPAFHRRSSLHPCTDRSIHPLANLTADPSNLSESKDTLSLSSVSFVNDSNNPEERKENESGLNDSDIENEDMFVLDEEMEDIDDNLMTTNDRRLSSRRASTKYIEDDSVLDSVENIQPLQSQDFATSLPISIIPPTPAYDDSKIHPVNVMYDPLKTVVKPTEINQHKRVRQKSFVGFDSAEADRRASLQLPPLDDNLTYRRKSTSAITLLQNKKNNNHKSEYSGRDNGINLNSFNEDEEEEGGPMIPPHILAANTAADETEALFGSVPHKSMRHRPLE